MTATIVQNIIKFMERANAVGPESFAWCEAYAALMQELNRLNTPTPEVKSHE